MVDAAAEAMFRSAEDDTSRDVLSLPCGPALDELLMWPRQNACSQSQSRRGRRQRAEERWLHDGISALNCMAAWVGLVRRHVDELRIPILAQRTATSRLARLYGEVGEPDESWGPLSAWSALLGTRPGYSDDVVAAGTSVTYRRGVASLPQLGGGKVDLIPLLPPCLQSALVEEGGLLLPADEAAAALHSSGHACAMDPLLNQKGSDYGFSSMNSSASLKLLKTLGRLLVYPLCGVRTTSSGSSSTLEDRTVISLNRHTLSWPPEKH